MKLRSAFALSLLFALTACGGGEDEKVFDPTFTNVQKEVFNRSCNISGSCHRGVSAAGSLNLEDPSYDQLFKAAVSEPSRMMIVANEPDSSFLLDKMINRNVTPPGTFMPPTGMIEDDRIDLVRRWIAAGAKND